MTELLYPRLPPAIAREIFDQYRLLTPHDLQARAQYQHPDATFASLGGTEVSVEHLEALAADVRAAASRGGSPDSRGDEEHREAFDQECAGILLTRMKVVAAEAASIDVWAFMGAVVLPDVCIWRFPTPPADRVIGPDLTRHTLARQWWRAYQLRDLEAGAGLAVFASISESEMNQLFERRTVGGNTLLVRAIARELIIADDSWADVRRRDLVREAMKRVLRLTAFTVLESLDEPQLAAMIRHVLGTTALALRHPSAASDRDIDKGASKADESAERMSAAPPATEDPEPTPLRAFDDVPLGDIPAQIAQLVNSLGGLPNSELAGRYGQRFGVQVLAEDGELLRRFAWSAKGR